MSRSPSHRAEDGWGTARASPRSPNHGHADDGWGFANASPRTPNPRLSRAGSTTGSVNRNSGVYVVIHNEQRPNVNVRVGGMDSDEVTIQVIPPTNSDGASPMLGVDGSGDGAHKDEGKGSYEHREHEHEDHSVPDAKLQGSPHAADEGVVAPYEPETRDPAYHYALFQQQQQEAVARKRAELEARGELVHVDEEDDVTLDGNAENALVRRPDGQLQRIQVGGFNQPMELKEEQKKSFREAIARAIRVEFPNEQGRRMQLTPPPEMHMMALPAPPSPQMPSRPVFNPDEEDGGLFS